MGRDSNEGARGIKLYGIVQGRRARSNDAHGASPASGKCARPCGAKHGGMQQHRAIVSASAYALVYTFMECGAGAHGRATHRAYALVCACMECARWRIAMLSQMHILACARARRHLRTAGACQLRSYGAHTAQALRKAPAPHMCLRRGKHAHERGADMYSLHKMAGNAIDMRPVCA